MINGQVRIPESYGDSRNTPRMAEERRSFVHVPWIRASKICKEGAVCTGIFAFCEFFHFFPFSFLWPSDKKQSKYPTKNKQFGTLSLVLLFFKKMFVSFYSHITLFYYMHVYILNTNANYIVGLGCPLGRLGLGRLGCCGVCRPHGH